VLETRKKRKGAMFRRLFQRSPTSFFSEAERRSASVVAVSIMLLFLLFFIGNGHTLAKIPNVVQPSLLTARINNASIRSSDRVSFQISGRPTIHLKPTSGFVGTFTTIAGDHFAQRGLVSVSFGQRLVAKTKTNQKGHFLLLLRVPLLALPGFNLVKAISANRQQSATASFTVVVPRPSASLSPKHGLPNTRITIKGKNFTLKGHIIILFIDPSSSISSVGTIVGRITASASGTINARFTVPRGLKRNHVYTIQVLEIQPEHSLSFTFMTK
jgi:hypothetical protein